MCDLHVAVGTNSLNHNASTEISNTVSGKDGNEVLPSSLPASQAIGTSGSNADPGSVDFGLILKDLLRDETNENSLTDLVNFRKDLLSSDGSRSFRNDYRDQALLERTVLEDISATENSGFFFG